MNYDFRTAFEFGKPAHFTAYRCEASQKAADSLLRSFEAGRYSGGPLKQAGLFVTLDWQDWALGMKVVLKLSVQVRNPVVTNAILETYKFTIAKRARHDCVISFPDSALDIPQIILFNPSQQVKSMQVFKQL